MEVSERSPSARPTTLVVCINRRLRADQPSCAARGAEALADALERGIAERCLDMRVERIKCLGYCQRGPNLRLAPGGAFFFAVGKDDLSAVLDRLETACGRDSGVAEPTDPPTHGT